jgi:hypothetical protein
MECLEWLDLRRGESEERPRDHDASRCGGDTPGDELTDRTNASQMPSLSSPPRAQNSAEAGLPTQCLPTIPQ